MARFRLFGRPTATPPTDVPATSAPLAGSASGVLSGTPDWSGRAPAAGPATDAARPAASWLPADHPQTDPQTDPVGFAPVDQAPPPVAPVVHLPTQPGPHPAEAAALAGAFAADYLSWDQEDPQRRGRVLGEYLADPGADPAHLGWSGLGRQRAEFALPGQVRPDGDGRVLVDVRVRVTPYRAVGDRSTEAPHLDTAATDTTATDTTGIPAVAPAPTGRGWRSLASYWIRLAVPVVSDGERLVVDTWEETLGEEPAERDPQGVRAPEDHSLADDDPVPDHPPAHEPASEGSVGARRTGGAW